MKQTKNLIVRLFIIPLMLFVGSCAVDRIDFTDTTHINTIGVVSLLGDRFHGIHFGNTPLQNEEFTTNVSQWQIDEFVNRVGTNILNEKYNIKSVYMPQDSRLLYNMYHKDEVAVYEARDYFKRVKGRITKMAKSYGADAVLVFLPKFSKDLAEYEKGYGLVSKSYFRTKGQAIYTMASVYMLDVKSGEMIGWADIEPGDFVADEKIGKWRGNFNRYSVTEKREIERALKDRIYRDMLAAFSSESLRITSIKRRMAYSGY